MHRFFRIATLGFAALVFASAPRPSCLAATATAATVVRAKPMPPDETPGARSYEMVWADRKPPRTPLVDFDSLQGWTLECRDGAVGEDNGRQGWFEAAQCCQRPAGHLKIDFAESGVADALATVHRRLPLSKVLLDLTPQGF